MNLTSKTMSISANTSRVLITVLKHGPAKTAFVAAEHAENLLPSSVKKALHNLAQSGYIINAGDLRVAQWQGTAKGYASPAGKGITPPASLKMDVHAEKSAQPSKDTPLRNGNTKELYVPHELAPYTGRPDANDHMQCGSVNNGKWMPYTPVKSMCSGAGQGIYGPSRANARSKAV